jgi:hypothetical protein
MASSSHLMPGEKGSITAKIDTLTKKGITSETIEVISNDPKRPKVTLMLQATIFENILPPMPQILSH